MLWVLISFLPTLSRWLNSFWGLWLYSWFQLATISIFVVGLWIPHPPTNWIDGCEQSWPISDLFFEYSTVENLSPFSMRLPSVEGCFQRLAPTELQYVAKVSLKNRGYKISINNLYILLDLLYISFFVGLIVYLKMRLKVELQPIIHFLLTGYPNNHTVMSKHIW